MIEAEIYPDEEYAKKQGLEREEEVRVELQKLIDEYNQGAPAYKKIYSLIIRIHTKKSEKIRQSQSFCNPPFIQTFLSVF